MLHVDCYYDLTCSKCGFSRSTDFGKGMEINKNAILKCAKAEGWREVNGKTLCPVCAEQKKEKNI